MGYTNDGMELGIAARAMAWGATALTLALTACPGGDANDDTSTAAASSSGGMESGSASEGEPPASSGAQTSAQTSDGSTTSPTTQTGDTTAGDDTTSVSEDSTGTPGEAGPDLRELGPHAVDLETGSAQLPGCAMSYDLRTPAGMPDAPVVVLAHGFQGNRASMAGWAEHWASWGLRVVTPNLCHASFGDTDHPQNGADLRALVTSLSLPTVIYAGYSAGGLAAVIATADDDQAIALLGLDMVDNSDVGLAAAAGVAVPAFDLVGEPSQCNTSNNGIAVFAAASGRVLRITEADHCDFQNPADFVCGFGCTGTNNQFQDAEIQSAVLGLSTAVVLWHTGLEPTGAQWWTAGEHYYELLADLGILQEV